MVSKKKPSVELLRIIACFIVLLLHTTEDVLHIDGTSFLDSFINMLLLDGVTIFWIITGFFIFDNNNYKGLLFKTFKKIWLPSFIVSIVCTIAYDYYLCLTSGTQMPNLITYLINFVYNALRFRTFAPSCRHFWFIYTYCLVVLVFPVLKRFVDYLDCDIKRQKNFVFVTLILLLINGISLNEFANIENHGFSAVVMASITIIYGHILFTNRKTIKKISTSILVLLFLLVNLIRSIIYNVLLKNGYATNEIVSWHSIFSFIVATIFCTICFNVNEKNSKHNDLILYIGSQTFAIYMFQKLPIKVLRKIGIEQFIEGSGVPLKYIMLFVYGLCCFVLTLLIASIYNYVIGLINKKRKNVKITER